MCKQALIAQVRSNLTANFPEQVVDDILESYEAMLIKNREGKLDDALVRAGRFVENVLRAIEYKRTGNLPSEIKSVLETTRKIENAQNIPDSLRLLIPRALYGMAYNIRSKRNAVHVKEVDPRPIDLAMCVAASSWTIAELIREYDISDPKLVADRMTALSRTQIPLIETISGEVIVARNVKPKVEVLLLLANAVPNGMSRRELGISAKCSPSSVTNSLQDHLKERYVHKAVDGRYHVTSAGEAHLTEALGSPEPSLLIPEEY